MTNLINLSRQFEAWLDGDPQPALEQELGRLALKHIGIAGLLNRLSPAELQALAQEVPLTPQMPAMIRSSLYTLSLERKTQAPTHAGAKP